MHIGIVGCGMGGAAAAALLGAAGHRVTVLERAPELHPIGAGLLIQPTGMEVLARLGLLERARAIGHRIDRLHGRTSRGRVVLDMGYADVNPAWHGLGMHRGGLFSLLLDAARARREVEIRVGCAAADLVQDDRSVRVVDEAGRWHGPFDLLVVADGARSRVRETLPVVRRCRPYRYAALWFVAESPGPSFDHVLGQVYEGTGRMVGFLPSGRATPEGPETISVFWSLRSDGHAGVRERGLAAWKAEVVRLAPVLEPLVQQIGSMDELVFAGYHDVTTRPVHHGRIVLLGDAAHAMSPQLGQGANLALVDAMDLADRLDGSKPLHEALEAHERARRRHTRYYSYASGWLTPWFQSDLEWLAPARDLLWDRIGSIPWVRRQSVLSLAGVKDGLFSSRPWPGVPANPSEMACSSRSRPETPISACGSPSGPA